MFSKSLIQFSTDEWGCVPSLLFDLRRNYGGCNEDNGYLLQKRSFRREDRDIKKEETENFWIRACAPSEGKSPKTGGIPVHREGPF